MIEEAVPFHKSQAVFHIPEGNYLGSFTPTSEREPLHHPRHDAG